jgi:hypothetical protein
MLLGKRDSDVKGVAPFHLAFPRKSVGVRMISA